MTPLLKLALNRVTAWDNVSVSVKLPSKSPESAARPLLEEKHPPHPRDLNARKIAKLQLQLQLAREQTQLQLTFSTPRVVTPQPPQQQRRIRRIFTRPGKLSWRRNPRLWPSKVKRWCSTKVMTTLMTTTKSKRWLQAQGASANLAASANVSQVLAVPWPGRLISRRAIYYFLECNNLCVSFQKRRKFIFSPFVSLLPLQKYRPMFQCRARHGMQQSRDWDLNR
mmetsp:Transcript_17512/g.34420  ORF Transcript_17512/g.34420 Transcript_17512/m.34420 type:complete len:224 (-) Transcript_17512:819-1490(-)